MNGMKKRVLILMKSGITGMMEKLLKVSMRLMENNIILKEDIVDVFFAGMKL